MNFNSIGFLIATFEHSTALARGVDRLDMPAKATVPEANMRAAFNYANCLYRQVEDLYSKSARIRWPVTSRTLIAYALGGALDACRQLRLESREVLGHVSVTGGEVRALKGGLVTHGVRLIHLAREPLEIVAGERSLEESIFAGMDEAIVEHVLRTSPVIGELIMVAEAVSGREAMTFRRLNRSERVINGLGVFLPRVLGHVVGRVGMTVSRVTRRAVRLAYESSKVYRVLDSPIKLRLFTQMSVGLRTVSEVEFKEFTALLMLEVRGVALTSAQFVRLNYFLFRMSARTRQAMWLSIVKKELGDKLKQGIHTLQKAAPKDVELAALQKYTELTKKPVVFLPEVAPAQYPNGKQLQGALFPDCLYEGELMEVQLTHEATSIENILGSFEGKDSQATKLLKVLAGEKVPIKEVSRRMEEAWANPRILNIDEITLFDGVSYIRHTRPHSYIPPFALEAMRLTAAEGARMVGLVEEAESDPL